MAAVRPPADGGGMSVEFLQARNSSLSRTLIRRFENILAASLDSSEGGPPALTDTAVQQLQLDVESTALVRATEEIMLLIRAMKELWLFGGLDTLRDRDPTGAELERQQRLAEEVRVVEEGFDRLLNQYHAAAQTNGPANGHANGQTSGHRNGNNHEE